jgi:hypothetical protein
MIATHISDEVLNVKAKGRINIGDSACQVEQFSGASLLLALAFAQRLRSRQSAFGKIEARSKESAL